jgi:hypothetical protein
MEESVTYQATLAKGAVREAKKILLLVGSQNLGPPDPATAAAIESLTDLDQLERLTVQVLNVSSWRELLPRPPSRRGGGRKGK